MSRRTISLVLAALLGIAISASVAWGVSQLTAQRIGLAAEPLSVIHGLAPVAQQGHRQRPTRRRPRIRHSKTSGAPTSPTPVVTVPSSPTFVVPPPPTTTVTVAPTPTPTPTPAPAAPSTGRPGRRDDSGQTSSAGDGGASAHHDD